MGLNVKKVSLIPISLSFINQFIRLDTCNIILFLMHEVLILTNIDLLPGLSRVKKMKTGRLHVVVKVTVNCCCQFSKAFTGLSF